MKLILFLLLSGSIFSLKSHAATQFFWDYSFGVDQFCLSSAVAYRNSLPEEGPINKNLVGAWATNSNEWTNEALSWTPRMQKAWGDTSSLLFNEVEEIIGQSLARNELTVSLFLCLNRNSMGAPLSVNIPYYLPTPALAYHSDPWWSRRLEAENITLPLPLSAFVEMTFHEVLHLYVMQIISEKKSKLLECKYAKESQSVRTHLHVFALEKQVYRHLSQKFPNNEFFKSKVLELSKNFFKVSGAKDYTRAWDIIDQQGAQPFLEELKSQNNGGSLCPWCTGGQWPSIEWLLKLINSNPSCG